MELGLSVHKLTDFAFQAQLQGILAVDAATNCLVLDSYGRSIDVAWPEGWRLVASDGSVALVTAAGETVARIGDAVAVGGGAFSAGEVDCNSCTHSERVFIASGSLRLLREPDDYPG